MFGLLLSAVFGYSIGLVISLGIVRATRDIGPYVSASVELYVATFVLTVLMCLGAALISIRKVTRIDPSSVFR